MTNAHGLLTLRAIIPAEVTQEDVLRCENTPITVSTQDGGTVFSGMAVALKLEHTAQYQELLAYPPRHSPFCALMHENPATCAHCQQSSIHLCQKSRRQGGLIVDRCHAGLTEAVAPLRDAANMIIGYIMFGQITILSSYEELLARILESCTGYSLPPDLLAEKASHITHVTPEQIVAAGEGVVESQIAKLPVVSAGQAIAVHKQYDHQQQQRRKGDRNDRHDPIKPACFLHPADTEHIPILDAHRLQQRLIAAALAAEGGIDAFAGSQGCLDLLRF